MQDLYWELTAVPSKYSSYPNVKCTASIYLYCTVQGTGTVIIIGTGFKTSKTEHEVCHGVPVPGTSS